MEPVNQMEGARLSEYTPESIREVAEVLAPQAKNYINAIGEQVGQAQQSIGPLAAQVMGESKTAGVGNYTYNRLARPQVDAMRDQILVQGYTDALNKMLSNSLRSARDAYNKSGNKSGNNTNNNTRGGWDGNVDKNEKTDTSLFWMSGNIHENVAYYGLLKKDRPEGMSQSDWYKEAKEWIELQARKHGGQGGPGLSLNGNK